MVHILNILLALHSNGNPENLYQFLWGLGMGCLVAGLGFAIVFAPCLKRKGFLKRSFFGLSVRDDVLLEEMNESLLINNIELQNEKEQLDLENKILASFSEEINEKKCEIEAQKTEIASSITYASVIQNALFPSEHLLDEIFGDYFIFFQPRDTVSGDFYFARKFREKIILVVADCTGHGVPGAFLSVLGFSLLEQVVNTADIDSAGILMNRLRRVFKSTLGQNRLEETNRDSIDMGFLIVDTALRQVNFSGANNDLFFIRSNGEDILCKGDRMPVGVHENDFVPFRDYYLHYNENDCLYLFSDGYPDQFGGPKGKKYGRGRFKEFLLYMHELPMSLQKDALLSNLHEWMESQDQEAFQVDDILVAGVKL